MRADEQSHRLTVNEDAKKTKEISWSNIVEVLKGSIEIFSVMERFDKLWLTIRSLTVMVCVPGAS